MLITNQAKAAQSAAKAKPAKAKPAAEEGGQDIKDWTVLMYIAGDNDLEPYAAKMMQFI